MREDVNHSMPEKRGPSSKAMAVYRHVNSCEFCDLDIVGRLVVYLFFQFLTLEKSVGLLPDANLVRFGRGEPVARLQQGE